MKRIIDYFSDWESLDFKSIFFHISGAQSEIFSEQLSSASVIVSVLVCFKSVICIGKMKIMLLLPVCGTRQGTWLSG